MHSDAVQHNFISCDLSDVFFFSSLPFSFLFYCDEPSRFFIAPGLGQTRLKFTLLQLHRQSMRQKNTVKHKKRKYSKNPLDGQPFMKGIILKTIIKKPKKPNSANRRCVIVRLSNGKEMTAYVPGKKNRLN